MNHSMYDRETQKQEEGGYFKLLSRYGLIFRLKMMEYCKPAQHYALESTSNTVKYKTKDILAGGAFIMNTIMTKNPHTLIDFTAWSLTARQIRWGVTDVERRKNRTLMKYKREKLFDGRKRLEYLHTVLNNSLTWAVILFAATLNFISQILWDGYFQLLSINLAYDQTVEIIFYALITMDHIVVFVFTIETVFWLLYDYKHYIRTFSFWATLVSICSTAYMANLLLLNGFFWMELSSANSIWKLSNQRVVIIALQPLRLILFARLMIMIKQVEIILTSIIQSLPSLGYVGMMMVVTTLIYWIIGMTFYAEYERENDHLVIIKYTELGLNEGAACLVFLFRLFTFDHWLDDYKAALGFHGASAAFYIIVWMVISNYIFGNLFAAVLINNFQAVRERLLGQYIKMQTFMSQLDTLRLMREELRRESMVNKLARNTIMDVTVPYDRREPQTERPNPEPDLHSDDIDSIILDVHSRLASHESIPYQTKEKYMIDWNHFDTDRYLKQWPPTFNKNSVHGTSSRSSAFDPARHSVGRSTGPSVIINEPDSGQSRLISPTLTPSRSLDRSSVKQQQRKKTSLQGRPLPHQLPNIDRTGVNVRQRGRANTMGAIKPQGVIYERRTSTASIQNKGKTALKKTAANPVNTSKQLLKRSQPQTNAQNNQIKLEKMQDTVKTANLNEGILSQQSLEKTLRLQDLLVKLKQSNERLTERKETPLEMTPSLLAVLRPLTNQELSAIEEDLADQVDQVASQYNMETLGGGILITEDQIKGNKKKRQRSSNTFSVHHTTPSRSTLNVQTGHLSSHFRSKTNNLTPSAVSHKHLSKSVTDIYKSAKAFDVQHVMSKISLLSIDSVLQAEYRIQNLLPTLKNQLHSDQSSVWCKDTLFGYFQAIEMLYENLKERERLFVLTNQAIMDLSDTCQSSPKLYKIPNHYDKSFRSVASILVADISKPKRSSVNGSDTDLAHFPTSPKLEKSSIFNAYKEAKNKL